jgi:hypothetical protein
MEERSEIQNLFKKIEVKWISGQKSLTFFLIGIIISLTAFIPMSIRKMSESIRQKDLMVPQNLILQKQIDIMNVESKEIPRLLFKEAYYKKKNDNLSTCLDSAWKYGHDNKKVTPTFIMWVMFIESRFNPNAVSNKGAAGVMQLMYPVWHEELKIDISRIFEIDYNTYLGVEVLKQLEVQYKGNMIKVLQAYNAGGRLENAGEYPYDVMGAESAQLKLVPLKLVETKTKVNTSSTAGITQ